MKKFTTAEDEMIITNFITESSKHENALCRWGQHSIVRVCLKAGLLVLVGVLLAVLLLIMLQIKS